MPIVTISVQVDDDNDAELIRSQLADKAEEIAESTMGDDYDPENTVSWEIEAD